MALSICDWSFIAHDLGSAGRVVLVELVVLKTRSISVNRPHSLQSISFSGNYRSNILKQYTVQYDFGQVYSQHGLVLEHSPSRPRSGR